MSKALEIQNLTYKKNQKVILDNINLDLAQGKIVALLGENGAGKTTLMRCIAGVAKNWSGSIKVAGKSGEAEKKANLAFTDKLTGFSDSTKIKHVIKFYETIYSDFDLEEFTKLREFMQLSPDMRLGQLSRGMREKLVIALTFARKADLYLLDEPFSGIDPMARKKIINSIILWKDDNATILISDHFVNEIATLLDEVIILKDNRILTHQSADQIRSENTSIESFYQAFYEGEE